MNYYNENDPFAAAWLRELIKANQISPGEVDERSIEDVLPSDLTGYNQCHFFAGIGGWSYALRQAGWPDDREVWTGSCPCQPFSAAGKRAGTADERHLWPAFFHLITQSAPRVVFGEQVASKDGLGWFDTVQADLESAAYACWAWDLCAAGVGAPHIRQRLYFVADSSSKQNIPTTENRLYSEFSAGRDLGYAESERCGEARAASSRSKERISESGDVHPSWMENAELSSGTRIRPNGRSLVSEQETNRLGGSSDIESFWRESDWIPCSDQKYRPVEPGTFPLAHGVPNRVGRLRGYGNAIVAPLAQTFIEAYLECINS